MSSKKKKTKIEFGDFQTPIALSQKMCAFLARESIFPASIIEPTCGRGNILISALESFPGVDKIMGFDLNTKYIESLQKKVTSGSDSSKVELLQANFFELDWKSILDNLPQPVLIVGNLPWVTNSALGAIESKNIPRKTNFQKHSGLDAITGKSNFDISEWMLIHLLESINGREGVLAMLCKSSVARKVLKHAWKNNLDIHAACIYQVNAKKYFNVAVDMGLFVCHSKNSSPTTKACKVHSDIGRESHLTTFGFKHGHLIAELSTYDKWAHLAGGGTHKWRSGIKHDAAKVMELVKLDDLYQNALGEVYDLEDDYIYPLLKSSDIAKGKTPKPRRFLLVTQTRIGENTQYISSKAPKTWAYLKQHKSFFEKRKSSIYKNKPPFSIFGVGDYSFAPWKLAISGLYKSLNFSIVGPSEGKVVVLDDTCYFIPAQSKDEVYFLAQLLNSSIAKEFLNSQIFWDSKRPITAGVLKRLNLAALAQELGLKKEMLSYLSSQSGQIEGFVQAVLF